MALPQLTLSNSNVPVEMLLTDIKEGATWQQFELNTPYQRGLVWGEDRKRNFIKSVLMGIPTGTIVTNGRYHNAETFMEAGCTFDQAHGYAVIDGKQRITALRDFYLENFTVPADWFDVDEIETHAHDNAQIAFTDLTRPAKLHFQHKPIALSTARVTTIDDEAEIFDLINFGGVPQGESDLAP